jgi:peptidoglycan/xylan/chitin deacetylase (PgdA/CDA1 family)
VPDVLVLCYHAVSEDWPSPLAVTPDQLERQLRLLIRRGYCGATFEQAVTSPPAARRVLAVTFDDGYRSTLTHAQPILDRLGLRGTVFVPTSFVGADGPLRWPGIDHWVGTVHQKELTAMSWDELRLLQDAGWEVGSHTCTHPRLSRLDDASLLRELRESRQACEDELGACRSLALPYGDGDRRVVAAAAAAGYSALAGLPTRWAWSPGWGRVGVYPGDGLSRFRVKVARPVRTALALVRR